MGLFDKKFCSVCGEKIGVFGNRKLDDGNLCKDCAAKLSPWFSERRQSTVEDIKRQLEYREANKAKVAAFDPVRTLGYDTKVMFDDRAGRLIVSSSSNWKNSNPDVIDYADVTGCSIEISEGREEIRTKDAEGKSVSYDPPRYNARYDIYAEISVDNPWFSSMRFKVNPSTVVVEPVVSAAMGFARPGAPAFNRPSTSSFHGGGSSGSSVGGGPSGGRPAGNMPPVQRANNVTVSKGDPRSNAKYNEYMRAAEEIKRAVLEKVDKAVSAAAPKTAVVCPFCGATTIPDSEGRCEYCGAPITQS